MNSMELPNIRPDQWLSLLVLCAVLVLYPSFDLKQQLAFIDQRTQPVALTELAPVPVLFEPSTLADVVSDPIITASSAAVIDLASGALLFEKNAQDVYLPASTTKLMTALVTLDTYSLDTVLTVDREVQQVDGAKVEFYLGEQLTVHDLLKALLIQSGNDAALMLAKNDPDGLEAFIRKMNIKAAELHLDKTIFENPTGFDGVHHQTTAYDLALLTKKVLENPVLAEIVATPQAIISDKTGTYQHSITTTNELLLSDPTVKGVKTGTTEGARQVLITAVERNGHTIIIVLMSSADRYLDTRILIDWVFSRYSWITDFVFVQSSTKK